MKKRKDGRYTKVITFNGKRVTFYSRAGDVRLVFFPVGRKERTVGEILVRMLSAEKDAARKLGPLPARLEVLFRDDREPHDFFRVSEILGENDLVPLFGILFEQFFGERNSVVFSEAFEPGKRMEIDAVDDAVLFGQKDFLPVEAGRGGLAVRDERGTGIRLLFGLGDLLLGLGLRVRYDLLRASFCIGNDLRGLLFGIGDDTRYDLFPSHIKEVLQRT